jgi:hypothetical protein
MKACPPCRKSSGRRMERREEEAFFGSLFGRKDRRGGVRVINPFIHYINTTI